MNYWHFDRHIPSNRGRSTAWTDKLKPADMMPGSFGLPLIGNTALTKQELFYWQRQQECGNVFKVAIPIIFGNIACLIGPDANRFVLKDGVKRSNPCNAPLHSSTTAHLNRSTPYP